MAKGPSSRRSCEVQGGYLYLGRAAGYEERVGRNVSQSLVTASSRTVWLGHNGRERREKRLLQTMTKENMSAYNLPFPAGNAGGEIL